MRPLASTISVGFLVPDPTRYDMYYVVCADDPTCSLPKPNDSTLSTLAKRMAVEEFDEAISKPTQFGAGQ